MVYIQNRLARFSITLNAWVKYLSNTGRGRKQAVSMFTDASIVALALWSAYSLRHGMPFSDFRHTWHLFVFLPLLTVMIGTCFGIYRWVIRSTNRRLFQQLVKASVASALVLSMLMFVFPSDGSNPRSLFIIYGMLFLIGTATLRLVWQSLFDVGKKVNRLPYMAQVKRGSN